MKISNHLFLEPALHAFQCASERITLACEDLDGLKQSADQRSGALFAGVNILSMAIRSGQTAAFESRNCGQIDMLRTQRSAAQTTASQICWHLRPLEERIQLLLSEARSYIPLARMIAEMDANPTDRPMQRLSKCTSQEAYERSFNACLSVLSMLTCQMEFFGKDSQFAVYILGVVAEATELCAISASSIEAMPASHSQALSDFASAIRESLKKTAEKSA